METGKNVIAENEGYCRNKSDIGIWTEELESIIQGYRELGRMQRKSLKSIMQKRTMRNYSKRIPGYQNYNIFSQERQYFVKGSKYSRHILH